MEITHHMERDEGLNRPASEEPFWRALLKGAYDFASFLGFRGADRDDLVQHGMLVMVKKVEEDPALVANPELAGWLLGGIMKKRRYKVRRHEAVELANEGDVGREMDAAGSRAGKPEFDTAMTRLRGLEFTALNELNPFYEQIAYMRWFEGRTIEYIAAQTSKSRDKVRKALHRAKAQLEQREELRAFFDEWDFD